MKKLLPILLCYFCCCVSATNIHVDESKFPINVKPSKGNLSQYMSYSDCENLVGHYLYLVNNITMSSSHFFVKNFKSDSYLVNKNKPKYQLFNNASSDEYVNKVYKVSHVKYVKVKQNWSSSKHFIELTLVDIDNPKKTFKYLNEGEFRSFPHCPFVDVSFYKYHKAKYDKSTRYKIHSKVLKGSIYNYNTWWRFKEIAYEDISCSLIYVFESEDKTGYVMEKDTEDESAFVNETTWESLCQRKGEDFAQCKFEHVVKLGLAYKDVLDIMGKPDGIMYDKSNIHSGYTILAYGMQWIEFNNNIVTNVDLYKTLRRKGDEATIDRIFYILYH